MGSRYGSWTIHVTDSLFGATALSGGIGEDVSFEMELLTKFGGKLYFVDPTPRSIIHFAEILQSLGNSKECDYSVGGKQSIKSYDLRRVKESQLTLIKKALWNESGTVNFHEPVDKTHVSYSINNIQSNTGLDSSYIVVPSQTISSLVSSKSIEMPAVIKLDIEGAEIEVVADCLGSGIFPQQFLLEYDEINFPSAKGKARILQCHRLLKKHDYILVNTDYPSNYLYVRKDLIRKIPPKARF